LSRPVESATAWLDDPPAAREAVTRATAATLVLQFSYPGDGFAGSVPAGATFAAPGPIASIAAAKYKPLTKLTPHATGLCDRRLRGPGCEFHAFGRDSGRAVKQGVGSTRLAGCGDWLCCGRCGCCCRRRSGRSRVNGLASCAPRPASWVGGRCRIRFSRCGGRDPDELGIRRCWPASSLWRGSASLALVREGWSASMGRWEPLACAPQLTEPRRAAPSLCGLRWQCCHSFPPRLDAIRHHRPYSA